MPSDFFLNRRSQNSVIWLEINIDTSPFSLCCRQSKWRCGEALNEWLATLVDLEKASCKHAQHTMSDGPWLNWA
jgi:hypothetical protein